LEKVKRRAKARKEIGLELLVSSSVGFIIISLGLWSIIPSLGVRGYFAYRTYKDYKSDLEETERLSRLTGRPIIGIEI